MKVLVSGASMAGLSAAYWFDRLGADVTVVEQCSGLRRGGAPIDIRGDALGTVERMGLLEAVRRQAVPMIGPGTVLDSRGAAVATIDLTWFANETSDDVEITRDRLNDLLFAAVGSGVDFRFGTTVTWLSDDDDAAHVRFSDGRRGAFDLVVGADGLHSTTRRLAFGPESQFLVHQGCYVALVDLDPSTPWRNAMYSSPGLMAAVREVGDGPLGYVLVRSEAIDYDYRDLDLQRRLVVSFLDRGDVWELPRLRGAFADPRSEGFYFDSLSQTRMSRWTRGRVVLIGDAAHCASLLSGMGTSLAMTAADYLAHEVVAAPGDLRAAFAAFERRQRPLVDKAQASVEDNGFMMVPDTAEALDRRNALLRELAARHN
ncbi:FAD-dependent oxidoreductase [Acrocarpospora pleiomorpha]|uniref:FAD-dependent oxidoreductase n=1 Tax=Acrocarpospora pleiomorpha TaxID=90975 RepID=A0A5M3X673_9ACTN|nr:FAD-dependent monooxygenase [Acrocarpospora pleiomorpha]GES17175.1 FAD-dependent oxidoreductase [Acrocarpospora pleiomorpha]